MRNFTRLLLAAIVVGLPGAVGATPFHVEATFTLQGLIPTPISVGGSGEGASDGFGAAAQVPAGLFAANAQVSVPYPDPPVFDLVSIPSSSLDNPGATFGPGGGSMGISGAIFFSGFFTISIPLTPIGGGGTAQGSGPIPVVVSGAPWQYAANAVVQHAVGSGVLTATAYDNRAASGLGTLQLVAPATMDVIGTNTPLLATLTLTYTPEPGTLALLSLGVAALAAQGYRRTLASRRA